MLYCKYSSNVPSSDVLRQLAKLLLVPEIKVFNEVLFTFLLMTKNPNMALEPFAEPAKASSLKVKLPILNTELEERLKGALKKNIHLSM